VWNHHFEPVEVVVGEVAWVEGELAVAVDDVMFVVAVVEDRVMNAWEVELIEFAGSAVAVAAFVAHASAVADVAAATVVVVSAVAVSAVVATADGAVVAAAIEDGEKSKSVAVVPDYIAVEEPVGVAASAVVAVAVECTASGEVVAAAVAVAATPAISRRPRSL
ncbi:hypothetical protein HK102_002047, partial [Quaeritorhiza haematococci]